MQDHRPISAAWTAQQILLSRRMPEVGKDHDLLSATKTLSQRGRAVTLDLIEFGDTKRRSETNIENSGLMFRIGRNAGEDLVGWIQVAGRPADCSSSENNSVNEGRSYELKQRQRANTIYSKFAKGI